MVTGYGSVPKVVEAMNGGAFGFIEKPIDAMLLLAVLDKATEKLALAAENRRLRSELHDHATLDDMVARSDKMKQLFTLVRKVAPSDASVLILGENGTGKELVASAIHQNSKRAKGPFIKINCAAIPSELIESELFGHKRGSFTGALADRPGVIELADGGSLLLDEIGEMPAALQAKLLRVLQEREFTPVGSTRPIKSDFRLICATNVNLDAALADKKLRQDLYFRINTFTLAIPPLRERTTDIPLLAEYFLERYTARHQRDGHRHSSRRDARAAAPPVAGQRARTGARHRARGHRRHRIADSGGRPAGLAARRRARPGARRRDSRASHARGDRADGDSAHARADAVEQARGRHHPRRLPADALQQAEEIQPAEAAGAGRRAEQLIARDASRRPPVEQPSAETDRTSDAFIRQVAHDLRASLNVVVSWAELVKAGQLPPEDVSRAGDTIVRHARHLSERLGVALDPLAARQRPVDHRAACLPGRRHRPGRGRRGPPALRKPSRELSD